MHDLFYLLNNNEYNVPILKRYNEIWDAYIECFGDADDLLKYTSTGDCGDEEFLNIAIKLEKAIINH